MIRECADTAGTVGRAELVVNIDSTPPTVTIDPDTSGGTSLRFSATDEVSGSDHFICAVPGQPVGRCESPLDVSEMPTGVNYIAIQAVDKASTLHESSV